MGSVKDKAKAVAGDVGRVVSAGAYNPDTGGLNLGAEQGANFVSGGTGGGTQASFMPQIPPPPEAEDTAEQAARAAAEAASKAKEMIGKGLSSTVLGGSLSADQGILKKKKLLGE